MRLLNAVQVTELLPMRQAIAVMREAFLAISGGAAAHAARQALTLPAATGLLMGAAQDGVGLGAKLVAIAPGNRERGMPGSTGLVLLLDDRTGEALALLDGASLTAVRTAALNGCAIEVLARRDARRALLVGCGTQAATQLVAMDQVRDLEEIRVLGRDRDRAERFAEKMGSSVRARLAVVTEAGAALEGVDLVTAATDSRKPVLPGTRIPAGCHVSGIGSFTPEMREFDQALLARARIFVESRRTAMAEAGELIAASRKGLTSARDWAELGEVLAGERPGRDDASQVTYFKSVGHPVFDLHAARAIYSAAARSDRGYLWSPQEGQ